jgi:cobalt-zinc-cadmium efflux system membrane fusion protein
MKTIHTLYIVTAVLFATLCACNNTKTEKSSNEEDSIVDIRVALTESQFKSIHITTAKIETKTLGTSIEVNGVLDVPPQNLVTVSALLGGFIKSTDILQGMHIKKGSVIASIQNPEFVTIQRDYLENKSKLKYLEQEFKRQEELSKENVSAAKVFQQVSSEYNSALVANGALGEKLKMIGINPDGLTQNNIKSTANILSPINGYITVVNVNIGTYVNPQDVICEIVDTEHLHAELTVFEKDVTKIKVGQKIKFTIVNAEPIERSAHVYLINHKISSDRTVRVHAHMDKNDPTLIPNMYLKATIEVGEQEVLAVPDKALIEIDGEDYIFAEISSNQSGQREYKAINVQKGVSENNYTAIELPAGMDYKELNVVVEGSYDLLATLKNIAEEE